jgi:Rapamycin-insensitive companion of mTOR, middle domain
MEKAKLFTAFYHLSELRSREDLIKGIIENIDYSMFVSPHTWYEWLISTQ